VGDRRCELGMVGLGTMGRNLLLNMADHGHPVAGYDRDPAKLELLDHEAGDRPITGVSSAAELVDRLRVPRTVMMLVPAGATVDAVVDEFRPLLQSGDILIDGGNSFYRDTARRATELAGDGIHLLGIGVSGGERGARHGPSLMPGGQKASYAAIRPLFEDVAAKVDGAPCVAYLGPGPTGHYVKMVHNGIEYGLMQLIAECYDLMKRSLRLTNEEIRQAFLEFNQGELASYLIEITAEILGTPDAETGEILLDVILDEAAQKGTGRWTSQDAMDLGVPLPIVDLSVMARSISARKAEREALSALIFEPPRPAPAELTVGTLRQALYAAVILTYSEGFSLLAEASAEYDLGLNRQTVARIWRGGCIIRAALLEDIMAALQREPELASFLFDTELATRVVERQAALRSLVTVAAGAGIPVPAHMAALAHFDGYRTARLPANLTAAQRDFFGAHTYRRIDRDGVFHTDWEQADRQR
jgi:6-phosphogluconate dehydrogenase